MDASAHPLNSALGSLFDRAVAGEHGQAAASWGAKSNYSVFDEEAVLAWPGSASATNTGPPLGASLGGAPGAAAGTPIGWPPADFLAPWQHTGQDLDIVPVLEAMEESLHFTLALLQQAQTTVGGVEHPTYTGGVEPRGVTAMRKHCCVHLLPDDGEDACVICFEQLKKGQCVWRLPCFHQAHESCSVEYFARPGARRACPLCRWDVRQGMPDDGSAAAAISPRVRHH